MEKDKIIIISQALQKKIKKNKPGLKYDICFTRKKAKEIKRQITNQYIKHIIIYDETYSPQHRKQEKIPTSDHINKTGTNSLIPKQERDNFIDLCHLYQQHKTKNITTSLGNKYESNKKRSNYPQQQYH